MSKKKKLRSNNTPDFWEWSFVLNGVLIIVGYLFYVVTMQGGSLYQLNEKIQNYFPVFITYSILLATLSYFCAMRTLGWKKVINVLVLIVSIIATSGLLFIYNIFVSRLLLPTV